MVVAGGAGGVADGAAQALVHERAHDAGYVGADERGQMPGNQRMDAVVDDHAAGVARPLRAEGEDAQFFVGVFGGDGAKVLVARHAQVGFVAEEEAPVHVFVDVGAVEEQIDGLGRGLGRLHRFDGARAEEVEIGVEVVGPLLAIPAVAELALALPALRGCGCRRR